MSIKYWGGLKSKPHPRISSVDSRNSHEKRRCSGAGFIERLRDRVGRGQWEIECLQNAQGRRSKTDLLITNENEDSIPRDNHGGSRHFRTASIGGRKI
jgi:hypothetical protein